jgi:hypothetical protein
MFSTTTRSTRRVRIVSAAVAAGAMIAAFGFTASAASAVAGGPTNSTPPSYTGAFKSGGTITAVPGVWADTSQPVTYTYLWQDSAAAGTYDYLSSDAALTVPEYEIGHTLKLTVTATDGDDDDSSISITTPVVPNVDFTNVTAPVLSGGTVVGQTLTTTDGTWSKGGLALTYDWGISFGQSGDSTTPVDNTNTHVVNNFDQNGTLNVRVSATDATGTISVFTSADAVTIPASPVATDAGLTAANEGGVTGSQTKTDATVVVPAPAADGDQIYVYGYSTATPIGFFFVSAAHTITVPLGSLSKGLHKLALINSSGVLIGWLSVTAGGGLASTGVPVNAPLEIGGAGLLILLGAFSVIYVTRRNRKNANA